MSDLSKEHTQDNARTRKTLLGQWKAVPGVLVRIETRFVTKMYLQRLTILALVTISIVVALDISANIEGVINSGTDSPGTLSLGRVVYYSLLRASFVAPSVLLFAGVWGVVWAEYSLATSRERIMLFSCGKAYLPALVPALLVGSMVGLLHFAISGFVKPATIELESATTHRSYGLKFDRPARSKPEWISGSNFIIQARVEIVEDARLRQVYAFDFDQNGNLQRIIRADQARPALTPDRWTFHKGTVSDFPIAPGEAKGRRRKPEEFRFDILEIDLPLSPLWLENFGVLPILLPQPLLHAIIRQGGLVPDRYKYEMTVNERYASILYCIATVLLSAHLAMTRFKPTMMPYRALSVALVGFAAYFFFSITLMLGHHNYIPVLVAAWSIPVLTILLLAALVYNHLRKAVPAIRQHAI